ncbi:hypothetical protein [Alkalihalobacterium bogoriense]|uniref:hypothetical protein n=1 Tax=Alkalihalobacterium bogoriense TaxID=246272 RepID=UPI00047C7675|nr:hypothetical protein [Alkalihalobacterium bogoriense]
MLDSILLAVGFVIAIFILKKNSKIIKRLSMSQMIFVVFSYIVTVFIAFIGIYFAGNWIAGQFSHLFFKYFIFFIIVVITISFCKILLGKVLHKITKGFLPGNWE